MDPLPPVAPMPDPLLVKQLVRQGFSYVRDGQAAGTDGGEFTLIAPDGSEVFSVSLRSWQVDPEACVDNLEHALSAAIRRRRR